jgi:mRNA interferase RelE/StbE
MTIAYAASAFRALKKLPKAERERIVAKIEAYAKAPERFAQVKALTGREGMRLRVGDMRVIFSVEGDTMTVKVVGHRREIYD